MYGKMQQELTIIVAEMAELCCTTRKGPCKKVNWVSFLKTIRGEAHVRSHESQNAKKNKIFRLHLC